MNQSQTQSQPVSSMGGSPAAQATKGIVIILVAFVAFFAYGAINSSLNLYKTRVKKLIDYTANSDDMPLIIRQDLAKYNDAQPIGFSENERTGIEFSYSFFLFVHPSTLSGNDVLKHVFHKGFTCPWPLMGPGVFIKGDTNTMRVFMNTYKNPYMYVDVKNIPMQKWFHVVLNCYEGGLDVFINGGLANRLGFDDTIPYQNFQDILLFSTANYNRFSGSTIPSLGGENFQIEGAFTGYLSELTYSRYALSVGEIQTMMQQGPSSKLKQKRMEDPASAYLADDWWSHQVPT
jgi:hypothetical protein